MIWHHLLYILQQRAALPQTISYVLALVCSCLDLSNNIHRPSLAGLTHEFSWAQQISVLLICTTKHFQQETSLHPSNSLGLAIWRISNSVAETQGSSPSTQFAIAKTLHLQSTGRLLILIKHIALVH